MSTLMGQPGPDGGDVDLAAVARDAELLDRLAVRGSVPSDDMVAALLAAFAAEVDDGLDAVLVPDEDDPRVASLVAASATATVVPLQRSRHGRRGGHGLRTTTVAAVVAATLSIGGVAAAVTGDPLAPVKGLATAVGLTDPKPELPAAASANAKVNHRMVGLRRDIAQGRLDGVRDRLDQLRAMLDDPALKPGQRKGLLKRLAALEAALARAEAKAAHGPAQGKGNGPGQGKGNGPGNKPDTRGTSGDSHGSTGGGSGGGQGKAAPEKSSQGGGNGQGKASHGNTTSGTTAPDTSSDAGTATEAPATDSPAADGSAGTGGSDTTTSPNKGKGSGAGSASTGRGQGAKG